MVPYPHRSHAVPLYHVRYHYDIVPVSSRSHHGKLSSMTIDHAASRDWKLYLVQVGGAAAYLL